MLESKASCPRLLPIAIHDDRLEKTARHIPPSNIVDLPIQGSNEQARYRLVSAVVHTGEDINSGHYRCYVSKYAEDRDNQQVWIEYDDSNVKMVNAEAATYDLADNGYLYFYELEKFI